MSESAFIDPTTPEGQAYWQRRHNAELAHEMTYPVRNEWRQPIDPYANLCAELAAALHEFDTVMYQESDRLSGEGLSRQSNGIRILRELSTALRT